MKVLQKTHFGFLLGPTDKLENIIHISYRQEQLWVNNVDIIKTLKSVKINESRTDVTLTEQSQKTSA